MRLALVALLILTLHSPSRAEAQTGSPDLQLASARSSIETESQWATGLYVAGAVLAVAGAVSLGLGLGYYHFGLAGDAPVLPPDYATGAALFISGATEMPLGAVLLAIAIGLDVDSHSRGAALGGRTRGWRFAPGPGAIGLALAFDLDGT